MLNKFNNYLVLYVDEDGDNSYLFCSTYDAIEPQVQRLIDDGAKMESVRVFELKKELEVLISKVTIK